MLGTALLWYTIPDFLAGLRQVFIDFLSYLVGKTFLVEV